MEIDRENEEILKGFSRKPPPAGLRGRVLAAVKKRKDSQWVMMPVLRWVVLAFVVLGVISLIVDMGLSRVQSGRISSLISLSHTAAPDEFPEHVFLVKALGFEDSQMASWLEVRLRKGKKQKRAAALYRKFLDLKEDINGK